jgi:hypothetical protein
MSAATTWFWCTTHREPHPSDQPGRLGCSLAGPYSTRDEAEAFGRRTDPERFNETDEPHTRQSR